MNREKWVPYAKFGGAGIVGLTTIAVSAVELVALASLCGIDRNLAWTLPVALDVGGGVSTIIWVKATNPESATWGRAVALSALGASLIGNIVSHLIRAGLVHVTAWLITAVGAVYPIECFLMIHLLVISGSAARAARRPITTPRPEPRRTPEVTVVRRDPTSQPPVPTVAEPAPAERPSTEPAATNVHEIHPGQPTKRELLRTHVHHLLAQGITDIVAADVDRAVGAAVGTTKKHLKQWIADYHADKPPRTAVAGS